jgi:hypothetical protein
MKSKRCDLCVVMLLMVMSLVCPDGGSSFICAFSFPRLPSKKRNSHSIHLERLKLQQAVDENNNNEAKNVSRRRVVLLASSFLFLSSLAAATSASSLLPAHALNDYSTPTDRVVFRATTFPTKYYYEGTSPIASTTPTSAVTTTTTSGGGSGGALCFDPDLQREAIFERTAPSVVFLDTFTERRDAFSTNV